MRLTTTALSALAIALASVAAPVFAQTPTATATAPADVDQDSAIKAFFEEQDAEQLTRLTPEQILSRHKGRRLRPVGRLFRRGCGARQ